MDDRVGVRELRQNLSVYLRRVKAGEQLTVTEHGHPVAVLGPLPPANEDWYEREVREGRLVPASRPHFSGPPPIGPVSTRGTEALQEQREERLP
jgi:prevent-host-death family protein